MILDNEPTWESSKNKIRGLTESPIFYLFQKTIGVSITTFGKIYSIYPQHSLSLDKINLRLDFAIFVNLPDKTKSEINEYKFCIECDGHEFHKTKEQRENDNKRMRLLIKYGWTVIRYTGTEIYKFSDQDVIKLENLMFQSITGEKSDLQRFTEWY